MPTSSIRRLLIPRRCDPWIKNSFTHDIYSVYSSSISKKMYTLLVEQVTISNGVTAGWALTKTNTNSDHGVLWRLHAHAQCPFSRISARAWRMPLPLRHSASEQLRNYHCACARMRDMCLDESWTGSNLGPRQRHLPQYISKKYFMKQPYVIMICVGVYIIWFVFCLLTTVRLTVKSTLFMSKVIWESKWKRQVKYKQNYTAESKLF